MKACTAVVQERAAAMPCAYICPTLCSAPMWPDCAAGDCAR